MEKIKLIYSSPGTHSGNFEVSLHHVQGLSAELAKISSLLVITSTDKYSEINAEGFTGISLPLGKARLSLPAIPSIMWKNFRYFRFMEKAAGKHSAKAVLERLDLLYLSTALFHKWKKIPLYYEVNGLLDREFTEKQGIWGIASKIAGFFASLAFKFALDSCSGVIVQTE